MLTLFFELLEYFSINIKKKGNLKGKLTKQPICVFLKPTKLQE